jgi:uncharacterized protein (TIGR02001 family)
MYDGKMLLNSGGLRVVAPVNCLAFLWFALATTPVLATDLTVYGVLTTDYVKRGVSQSDSDPSVQLGFDINFDNGIFAGVWGASIDIDNGPTRHRDLEVNYYAGYGRDAGNDWRLTGSIVAYTYPGQTGNVDYNYEELVVSAGFKDMIWLEYAYSPDLYHRGKESHNVEVFAEWPLGTRYDLSGGAGYYDTSAMTGVGYGYWQLGISRSFPWFDIDLRYHDTNRDVFIVSTAERAESRVVLSLRFVY